uniref:Uncharacterized protein n=1 Tax=Aegilops tauschii subsp. strangulata TaxID=200361 RepID=A0A453HWU7_AEGTS
FDSSWFSSFLSTTCKATTRDCAPSCYRLFLMLQPFPVELKGRWKKLQEEWCSQRDIENQSRLGRGYEGQNAMDPEWEGRVTNNVSRINRDMDS